MLVPSKSIAPYHFRDLAEGIQQQMFFWGQDVGHTEGNFLVAQGFKRSPSLGAQGTSRYRLPWQNGHIELYGSCAGWYGPQYGFTFIRPRRRCSLWLSGKETPIPGAWKRELIGKAINNCDLYLASHSFLDWVISYEHTVLGRFGNRYREACYRNYRKVPKAKAWLEPQAALQWLECFRQTPTQLIRPKHFFQQQDEFLR